MIQKITPKKIKGIINVPGDKSISHRAVMLGALAEGTTEITNFLQAADCLSTLACFNALGVKSNFKDGILTIYGNGLNALREPVDVLNAGNSGTTMRLMSGILAGQPFLSVVTGDDSLRSRPMQRIVDPLSKMGANILTRNGGYAPLVISGGKLRSGNFTLPVASAQLKSAILLAGLFADGETIVSEPSPSRDHTERMLKFFGANIKQNGNSASISPTPKLNAAKITVPGDISSAAFFMVAALIAGDEEVLLPAVGINPTRTGIIDALFSMGADIKFLNQREEAGEPVADILVKPGELRGTVVRGDLIPRLIDEIPVLAVAAVFAEGETVIQDAGELRIKESDRLKAVTEELSKFGAKIEEFPDGLKIYGTRQLYGAMVNPRHDHRIAMAMAVAALASKGETIINDAECVKISFPDFWEKIKQRQEEA